MSALVIDNIGQLVTNDPELGEGSLGVVTDAALVCEGERVVAVERAGAAGDRRLDAGGRCVIPGFVDSHTHLVFAGDRAEEFAARMAGAPYEAGGIRVTSEATARASTEELESLARERLAEARRAGITTIEIKSGYALEVEGERRLCEVAARLTDEVTFLGAHAVPADYESRPDDYVALVCGEMLEACAPYCRWIDVFCERGAFDPEQSRAVLEAGRAAGLGLRVHGNQLGPGAGVALAVELGAASVDHCTYLTEADVEALAGGETVATFLPATDFSTRQPYPDARAVLDAGRRGRDRDQLQPGFELHDVDGVLPRPGRTRARDDDRGGAARGDAGRRPGPAPRRPRAPAPRRPRRRGRARGALLRAPGLSPRRAAGARRGDGGRAALGRRAVRRPVWAG